MILAIDPGPVKSALVGYEAGTTLVWGKLRPNAEILRELASCAAEDVLDGGRAVLVIEQIASYGMAVGAEVFETCFWSGRFAQAWAEWSGGEEAHRIPRLQVKIALCHTAKARDGNIRQALIDRWGGPASIRKGGALYRVKNDLWAALAVAVAWEEAHRGKEGV